MKKLIFFSLLLAAPLQAKTITLNIPDTDIAIVENDVMDAEQWIKQAWAGKLANCKGRLVQSEVTESMNRHETLPAGEDAIVQKAFGRPTYKSRKQRQADLDAKNGIRTLP